MHRIGRHSRLSSTCGSKPIVDWSDSNRRKKRPCCCGMRGCWRSQKASKEKDCARFVPAKLVVSSASNLASTIPLLVPLCVSRACPGSRSFFWEVAGLPRWLRCSGGRHEALWQQPAGKKKWRFSMPASDHGDNESFRSLLRDLPAVPG